MCFFFSSRRRHTRLQGDWSSDVCSSDLNTCRRILIERPLNHRRRGVGILDAINAVTKKTVSRESAFARAHPKRDRKSTRLNSSHLVISYAVFCLKKKTKLRLRPKSSTHM